MVNELTNFMFDVIYGVSSLSTASRGGHARPAKRVGAIRDVQERRMSSDNYFFEERGMQLCKGLYSQ